MGARQDKELKAFLPQAVLLQRSVYAEVPLVTLLGLFALRASPMFWELLQTSPAPTFSSKYVLLYSTQGEHFMLDSSVGFEVTLLILISRLTELKSWSGFLQSRKRGMCTRGK